MTIRHKNGCVSEGIRREKGFGGGVKLAVQGRLTYGAGGGG